MITATTTLGAFFSSIATQLSNQLSYAQNRVFVVDKLSLQDSAVPNLQIQPMSMTAVANNTGLNVCDIQYRIHAVVRVERDFAKRQTERLIDDRSAFLVANSAANALRNFKPNTGSSNQVFVSLEDGAYDELTKLGSASVTMRSYIRLNDDG